MDINRPWRVSNNQPGVILDSKGYPVCAVSILPVQFYDINSMAEFIVTLVNEVILIVEEDDKMDQKNLTDVHQAIMHERIYQDGMFGRIEEHPHGIPGWITIMRNQLDNAEMAWIDKLQDMALEEVLHATAVGFACLQQHGIPESVKRASE